MLKYTCTLKKVRKKWGFKKLYIKVRKENVDTLVNSPKKKKKNAIKY